MKKIFPVILLVTFLCFQGPSYAVDELTKKEYIEEAALENGVQVPPGMELRRIGGINMIVPQGAKLYKDGPVFRMEDDGGYASRKLKNMDDRFNKLDEQLKKIEEEIVELRKSIENIRK